MIAERLNNVILVIVLMLATLINVELMLYAQLASMSLPVPAHQIILEIQRKHVIQVSSHAFIKCTFLEKVKLQRMFNTADNVLNDQIIALL